MAGIACRYRLQVRHFLALSMYSRFKYSGTVAGLCPQGLSLMYFILEQKKRWVIDIINRRRYDKELAA